MVTDLLSLYTPSQVTGGHLAQVKERGRGLVFEQWSVFLLLIIPHPQVSCQIISISLNISQQCCILLGLLTQSDVDQFANLPTCSNSAHMTDAYTFCV